jgi:Uncharacterized protein conserved in archaea
MTEIPRSHPRYSSLLTRERLVEAYEEGILDEGALIEFGREEAVDYLIGERTIEEAYRSTEVAVSYILLSKNPMIVLDGVCIALAANEIKKSVDYSDSLSISEKTRRKLGKDWLDV